MKAILDGFLPKTNFATVSRPVQDLSAFGDETYEKHKDNKWLYYKFHTDEGMGWIGFVIEDCIKVKGIHIQGRNDKSEKNIIDDLIYTVRNNAASLKLPLVMELNETDDKLVIDFIKSRNDKLKNIDSKYHWRLE